MQRTPPTRRFKTIATFSSVLLAVAVSTATRGRAGDAVPGPSPDARSAVLKTLTTHCSGCHQGKRAAAAAPVSAFGNILELDELARDPTLVVPGHPDASRLYQMLLSRHQPQSVFAAAPSHSGPSADDVDTVRDWIESLSESAASCTVRPSISAVETEAMMQKWRRQIGSGMEDFRFVTLGYLANACVGAPEIERARADVASAIGHFANLSAFSTVWPVDGSGVLLAFRLEDSGLSSAAWQEIVHHAPRTMAGAIPGEWLAHRAGNADAGSLARHYRKDVGLRQAAAELGISESALSDRLATITGPSARIARPLRQGLVSRGEWETLARELGASSASDDAIADVAGTLRLRLWSDKVVYRSGDLTALTALSTADCHLTLVGIDHRGSATVLFPNEFEPSNFLRGSTPLTVPLSSATYQLRVTDPGTETIVGVCSTARQRMTGVLTDYERQRFTVLGNWRLFLATADQLEKSIARVSRRGRGKSGKAMRASVPPEEARAAITYRVEPNAAPVVAPLPVTAVTR